LGIVHGDLVVKNRYEPATFEQIVKVQLLFLAIFYDFAANCTKLTLSIVKVDGESMAPALKNGERILAYTALFRRQFSVGRIVTLRHFQASIPPFELQQKHRNWLTTAKSHSVASEIYVKRIVGLPFDTVQISQYVVDEFNLPKIDSSSRLMDGHYVWTVPQDHVFVRGDGKVSVDSITWGPIPISSLCQIVLCHYPSLRRIR